MKSLRQTFPAIFTIPQPKNDRCAAWLNNYRENNEPVKQYIIMVLVRARTRWYFIFFSQPRTIRYKSFFHRVRDN